MSTLPFCSLGVIGNTGDLYSSYTGSSPVESLRCHFFINGGQSMNIIFNEDCSLRTTKFKISDIYELSDIMFYVPNTYNCANVYVVISDNKLTDVIPLTFAGNSQSYKQYKVTYKNPIRVNSGGVVIQVMLVEQGTDNIIISIGDKISMNIAVSNYKLAHQTAATKELNTSVSKMYQKIVQMTNMNIEIYEKIQKDGDKT